MLEALGITFLVLIGVVAIIGLLAALRYLGWL